MNGKMHLIILEDDDDDEGLDEETLAMKAMGLPVSFTSSMVNKSICFLKRQVLT